ncbi:MAG: VCBS repeat-containing protein [Candidatus Sabulitectum sp.]|nr:VCBS repeat-containing protein [Candidatus Sabulitectum sp.]
MYLRDRSIVGIGMFTSLVLLFTGTISALPGEDSFLIPIPPGGYAWSVCDDSTGLGDFITVNTIAPGPLAGFSHALPNPAALAVELGADWLKEDLTVRFTDLLYKDVINELPVAPAFADVNGDGLEDLVLTGEESGSLLRAFIAPDWVEFTGFADSIELRTTMDMNNDGSPDSSFLSDEGVLTLYGGDSALLVTEGFTVSGVTGTALCDMEGDGLADLVVGTEAGNILIYRNWGTIDTPCFLSFSSVSRSAFPMNPGAFSSPALFLSSDSVLVAAVGTQQNGLSFYTSNSEESPEWTAAGVAGSEELLLNISPVVVDLSGDTLLVCGTRNGIIYEVDRSADSLRVMDIPQIPGTYPSLALTSVNGDVFPDLIAGTREGEVFFLLGNEGWFTGNWIRVDSIPLIPSGAPAVWGNGLVFGSRDGDIRYFSMNSRGNWVDCTENSEFCNIDVGEYSVPTFFDMDGDGTDELVVGSSGGFLTCFKLEENVFDESSLYLEKFSWKFEPNSAVSDIDDYYSRYFSPYSVFRSPSGRREVIEFSRAIIDAEPIYRDEIAYCIAHTPVDVLRAMLKNGDSDLFTVNASAIYEMAEKLDYVSLRDCEDGTVCSLKTAEDGWTEVSRENYYRFVVHPRILFETPARIDAEYWNTSGDTESSSYREWLNYESDSLYGVSPDHVFWREFIPSDTLSGRTLEDRITDAGTFEEAVIRLCNFQSHSQPEGLMSFGYMTNDLQPMIIYRKAYGSCGEQSILQTALCRTFFIPAYVVGCRGEDHQWSHYLDPGSGRWNHWDINYGISGIGNLWVSGEGVNHARKNISTISAFGPDGEVWPVTGSVLVPPGSGYMDSDSGYTHTAQVEISVADPNGVPVDGAMVMIRSHWKNANSVSEFNYTDETGKCTFFPGWEPNGGYTVDIVSPFGSAGSTNISFTEEKSYRISYTVPCIIPSEQIISLPESDSSRRISVSGRLFPVSYFAGTLYSLSDSSGSNLFRGRSWIPWRQSESQGEMLFMNTENFRDYRNGLNCNAVRHPFIPEPGDTCFAVLDNRSSFFTWREFSFLRHSDADEVISDASLWLQRHAEDREPIAALCTPDSSFAGSDGNTGWIMHYQDLELQQDDPDDPLSAVQILGPFRIPAGERSLSIESTSDQPGLDMDLFLFKDHNANRLLDGMSELESNSTSPTSSESISLEEPDFSAVFWIYMHGWHVDEEGGTFDLGLSFEPEMLAVHSLSPTGYQRSMPQEFSFATAADTLETGDIYLQSGEIVIFPEKEENLWCFETLSQGEFFADGSVQIFLSSGELLETLQWDFYPDSIAPELFFHSAEVDYSTMKVLIEVESTDEFSGIEKVVVSVDTMENTTLVLREDSIWNCSVDFLPFSGETVSVEVCAVDSAGNETAESCEIDVLPRPAVVFSSVYPSKSVYDHTPILQLFADFEDTISGWSAVAILSGNEFMEELTAFALDGNIIQFSADEFLQDGEYTVNVQILESDGAIAAEHSWSFTVETMTATR